jgi:subfamily B ATP-binding cassette protein HlyB/CyaB
VTLSFYFAATINQLKGQVTMLFITHALPKNLLVDEIVRIGQAGLSAVGDGHDEAKQQTDGNVHG